MTVHLTGVTWDHERGWGGLRAAAATFTGGHRDVEVTWVTRSLQAFADQPVEELAARYDLIVLDHPAIGHAVAAGALLPLDEYLSAEFLREQAASSAGRSHESYRWQDRQWALAIDAAAQVAVYRPDLLAQLGVPVPRTWDEVFALGGHTPGALAAPLIPVDAICAFIALCDAGGSGSATGCPWPPGRDAAAAAIAILERLAGAQPAALEWNPPRLLDLMATTGEVAYCPLAFGYVNYARPGFRRHPLRFAPAPGDASGVPRGTLGGAGIAVSARTPHPAQACQVAAHAASGAIQRGVYFDHGGQPGHRSAWTDPRLDAAAPGFFAATLPALDAATLRPRHDGFLGWQDLAGRALHRHLSRGGDRGALLDELDTITQRAAAATQKEST